MALTIIHLGEGLPPRLHCLVCKLSSNSLLEHGFQFFAWNLVSVFYSASLSHFAKFFCAYWN